MQRAKRSNPKIDTVPAYIAAAAPRVRPMLRELRRLVRRAAPKATEKISYRIPYYDYHGRVSYFAAFTNHVSLYLMGKSRHRFEARTKKYRTSSNTMRFAIGSKIPARLVSEIVRARVKEIEQGLGR